MRARGRGRGHSMGCFVSGAEVPPCSVCPEVACTGTGTCTQQKHTQSPQVLRLGAMCADGGEFAWVTFNVQSEVHSYSCCSTVGGMLGMAVYSEQISSLDMQWLSRCVAPPPATALSLRCASLELSTACCHVLVLTLWCTVRLLLQACDTGVAQNMSKASIYQGKSPLANSHTRTCHQHLQLLDQAMLLLLLRTPGAHFSTHASAAPPRASVVV